MAQAYLDMTSGPGGSFSTEPSATAALFRPVLGGNILSGQWIQARIFGLCPSQQIVAHCDAPIEGRRFHLPLASNPGCWSFHDDVWQRLEVGTVYEMDPTIRHGAVNWGDTLRLNLVVDIA